MESISELSLDMRKGVFRVNANSKDPDQQVEIYTCNLILIFSIHSHVLFVFVLRFYGPVNPMVSCRARSGYLTTHLLGRLSPLSG